MIRLCITEETPLRLDQYLALQKISPSRSQISRLIREGHVQVNALPGKPSQKLVVNDQIEIHLPETKPSVVKGENISLPILHEDKSIVVIDKPAHLVVHPGAGHQTGTLTHALIYLCKDLSGIGGVERPGIVHRLDKGTSGVMVIAKNDRAHLHLSAQFKNHAVKKVYWALVYGKFGKKEGTFHSNISRHPKNRKKFAVHATKGKIATTHYRVRDEGEGLSLVELQLETGRTHQIRVHLTDAGHPIVGDPLYGHHLKLAKQMKNREWRDRLSKIDHTLLHARLLEFIHPASRKKMKFKAELPEDFKNILTQADLSS